MEENKPRITRIIGTICVYLWLSFTVVAQVDPPSWWTRSSVNPVRVMIRGRDFQNGRVQVIGPGLRVVGVPKINERGTYIFADIYIAPNAPPGQRSIKV